ncbi:hypothetical protein DVZ84_25525 [Streptomyces parvulus]|uniref:Uncharacterized protein n=1 Tax=Streptomyces parvulus TaxID=146923 RepID=A0A369V2W0_9ACTN|nr:hypothetical protein DVZ84_25525 [Streptomyces parvulus]
MEICIAVADWARGPTTWVLDVPGGEGTGARRMKRPKHVRHTAHRATPTGTHGTPAGRGRRAGMVVGWG